MKKTFLILNSLLLILIITGCDLFNPINNGTELLTVTFNQTSLEWEDADFSFPEGTIGVKNSTGGSLLLAWTDTGEAYNYNSVEKTWEKKTISFPDNVKFLSFIDYDSLVIVKEDLTIWLLNNDQFEPYENQSVPLDTVDIIVASGIYTIQNDGSVVYYNDPDQVWENHTEVSFPENTLEYIYGSGPMLVRLSDNGLYLCEWEMNGVPASQNLTVPDSTKSTLYYNYELYVVY